MTSVNQWAPPAALIDPAMLDLLQQARAGLLPVPGEFQSEQGVRVLALKVAHVSRCLLLSEPGRTFMQWLPTGNKRPAALREALAASGWLLTRPGGGLLLADRVLSGRRHAAVVFVVDRRRRLGR